MQCQRCGSEQAEVVRTHRMRTAAGKYCADIDTRISVCCECGLTTYVECKKKLIEVFDADTLKKKMVTPEEYDKVWKYKDFLTRKQINDLAQTRMDM